MRLAKELASLIGAKEDDIFCIHLKVDAAKKEISYYKAAGYECEWSPEQGWSMSPGSSIVPTGYGWTRLYAKYASEKEGKLIDEMHDAGVFSAEGFDLMDGTFVLVSKDGGSYAVENGIKKAL